MGLEFREANYVLNAKNEHVLKTGMVINLSLGFQDLDEGSGRTYEWLFDGHAKY